MKNLPNLTFITLLTIITLQVNGDYLKDRVTSSNNGPQEISKQQVDQLRQKIKQQHQANNANSRASDVSLILDYFTCEEEAASNDGFDWYQYLWSVNRNWPAINYPSFKWIMTDFYTYTGYDADDPNAVCADYSINYYSLDSIYIPIAYENVTGNIDTLIITVYGGTSLPSIILWTDTFMSGTDFISGAPYTLQNFYVYPGLSFNAQEYFAVRLDFVGDTANTFTALAGYRDECNDLEGASENVLIPTNSIYFINADFTAQGGINLTGINSVGFTFPNCAEYFTQNWLMWPFLTANVNFAVNIVANQSGGCNGSVIGLNAVTSGATGNLTYSWSATTGQLTSTTIANPSLIMAGSNSIVKVTVTDGSKTAVDSMLFTLDTIYVSLPNNIEIYCGNDTLIVAQVLGELSGIQYSWSGPNGTSQSPTYTVSTYGLLSVTVTNSSGCSSIDAANVIPDPLHNDCVWPGDANNDGIANNIDILAIGLAYNFTGTTRPNASLNWVAQQSANWFTQLPNGTNNKFVDCNGDGVINSNDNAVVNLNYGQTHLKGNVEGEQLVDPPLIYNLPDDTILAGETITVDVELGSQTIPVDSIYGISFTIEYDNTLIEDSSISFEANDSWMGLLGQTIVDFYQDLPNLSKLDVTITRIDQNNIAGYGKIGELTFKIKDNISAGSNIESLNLDFSTVTAIDNDMNELQIFHEGSTIHVSQWPVGIAKIDESKIAIYPNPTKNQLTIETGGNVSNWQIVDLFGREIKSSINPKLVETLDVSIFESGIYFIRLQSEGSIVAKRFTVVK